MVELVQCGGSVAWHGERCGSVDVIPGYADPAVEQGIPVEGYTFIVSFEDGNEMVRMFFSDVFDGEIIDHKYEGDGAESM